MKLFDYIAEIYHSESGELVFVTLRDAPNKEEARKFHQVCLIEPYKKHDESEKLIWWTNPQ